MSRAERHTQNTCACGYMYMYMYMYISIIMYIYTTPVLKAGHLVSFSSIVHMYNDYVFFHSVHQIGVSVSFSSFLLVCCANTCVHV